jgi:hypothetical protein
VLPPKAIHIARLLNLSLSRGFVLLFVLAATAWAVDPNRQITLYAHTAWRIQDGFFNNVPTAVTQSTRYTVLRGSRYEMPSATHRPDISRRKSPMANLCVYAFATMERALTQAWLNAADVPGIGACQESASAPNRSERNCRSGVNSEPARR